MAQAKYILLKHVDFTLHRGAKAAAAFEGVSLMEWVKRAIAEKLAGPRPTPGRDTQPEEVAAPVQS
jgi:hypothetical protein